MTQRRASVIGLAAIILWTFLPMILSGIAYAIASACGCQLNEADTHSWIVVGNNYFSDRPVSDDCIRSDSQMVNPRMMKSASIFWILILACSAVAGEYAKTPLAAHRGESYIAPENTMASFELAWKSGDTIVETDIHLTKDGQVVICHDADTFRTSGNQTKVVIKDSALEEIRKVDVG